MRDNGETISSNGRKRIQKHSKTRYKCWWFRSIPKRVDGDQFNSERIFDCFKQYERILWTQVHHWSIIVKSISGLTEVNPSLVKQSFHFFLLFFVYYLLFLLFIYLFKNMKIKFIPQAYRRHYTSGVILWCIFVIWVHVLFYLSPPGGKWTKVSISGEDNNLVLSVIHIIYLLYFGIIFVTEIYFGISEFDLILT